jgi:hypothetical protein
MSVSPDKQHITLATMKRIFCADWRPPNKSTSQGRIASIPGMRPVSIITGSSTLLGTPICSWQTN